MSTSIKTIKTQRYGWLPDLPDARDLLFAMTKQQELEASSLPAEVDLRKSGHLSPVYDQGDLGSCTANALAAAFDFDRHAQGKAWLTPSRLWVYYQERVIEDSVDQDAGAMIRDGIKVLKNIGVVPESEWKYVVSKFATKPSPYDKLSKEALTNESLTYKRVTAHNETAMKTVLASGKPFVTGITCYESFEADETIKTGIVPLPEKTEQTIGGHAILIVGYVEKNGELYWVFRNSWGKSYGDAGYGYLPKRYLTAAGLASDQWVIETVEAA